MERWQLISEMIAYIEDEGHRPHVILQSGVPGTCGIPPQFIKNDGHVVLNISHAATAGTLRIGMYQCAANMRFNGQHHAVAFHPDAVVGIYSPDGGPKLLFPEVNPDEIPDAGPVPIKRPKLSLVGGTECEATDCTDGQVY